MHLPCRVNLQQMPKSKQHPVSAKRPFAEVERSRTELPGNKRARVQRRRLNIFAASAIACPGRLTVPCAFISVKVGKTPTTAIVDTGSSFSFVSDLFARGSHLVPTLKVHMANGTTQSISKANNLTVTIGALDLDHHFYVLSDLPLPFVLGLDFLARYKISIHPDKKNIRLSDGQLVSFESNSRSKLFAASVFLEENPEKPTKPVVDLYPRPLVGDAKMTKAQRQRAQEMLQEHSYAFATADRPLGNVTSIYHRLKPKCAPFKAKLASLSPHQLVIQQECIDEMLKYGVVVPSRSEWASRPSFAPKPDGSTRFCLNFRKLNQFDTKDSYPLPRAADLINPLGKALFFTKLDAAMGYWQIPIHPDDRKYTAVITHAGLFEFVRMPFGLTNAPATYQRLMDIILTIGNGKFCCVYLDDVLVWSLNFEDHMVHVRLVIQWMADAGLLLKVRKCSFFDAKTEYLGHIVGNGEIRMTKKKMRSIFDFVEPHNVTTLQSFLGVTGYYRKFIKDYSKIVAPLYDLTKKGVPFTWNEKCHEIFMQIRQTFNTDVVLRLPDYERQFLIDTDASDVGVGAVLSQIDDFGCERPLQFASRKLSKQEVKWPVRDKEALAIVYGVTTFRAYILGAKIPFLVRTDHHSLQWLMDAKNWSYCSLGDTALGI